LKPKGCVLFLGSGPLPLSLIVLCQKYDLQGIGIEQVGKRSNLSREVIACLGIFKRIKIIEGNHFILPLKSSCDLYMIAAQVNPKRRYLNTWQRYFLKEVKSPTASTKRVLEKFWTVVLYSSCLPDL
jgi:hypothetical protein